MFGTAHQKPVCGCSLVFYKCPLADKSFIYLWGWWKSGRGNVDEAGLVLKLDSLLLACRRPLLISGMVQFDVNSNSRLSSLRPRILAIARLKKTQANNITAVTVCETRSRLLRGKTAASEAQRKSFSSESREIMLKRQEIISCKNSDSVQTKFFWGPK